MSGERAVKWKPRGLLSRGYGALVGVVLFGACACSVLGAPSKVRAGQLYAAGSARYDTYFAEVYALQVGASAWPDERKNARKPLLDGLKLPPDADDATIAQSTKDRLSRGLLHLDVKGSDVHVIVGPSAGQEEVPREILAAVEVTAHAEIERSKKLSELPPRALALSKSGHELEAHIAEDFAGEGQKPFEVRQELHASYDVLSALTDSAARERRAADQLVAELGRAVSTGSDAASAVASPPKVKPAKAPPSSKPEGKPLPKPAPVSHGESVTAPPKPAPPPPAAPKPAVKSDTEVFNP
jgi:hypothetical protein